MGFAGAYIGGDHSAERIRWIIERSEAIADNWQQYVEEISYGPKDGFFFFDARKQAPKPREMQQKLSSRRVARRLHVGGKRQSARARSSRSTGKSWKSLLQLAVAGAVTTASAPESAPR